MKSCALALTTLAVPDAILRESAINADAPFINDTSLFTSTGPTLLLDLRIMS